MKAANEQQKHVLVIGGGIGGLTAAIALQQAGIKVTVFEQAEVIREVGAGLSLWANAVKALYRLGLRAELEALSIPEVAGGFYNIEGKKLAGLTSGEVERRYGAPNLLVHRAELLEILRRQLDSSCLVTGARLERFEQNAAGATAYFTGGKNARGDLLVGADGIHSKVREQLFGPVALRYSGYTAWRGIAPAPSGDLTAGETWGRGRRFGIVPLSRERVYWFATDNRPAGQPDPPEGAKAELLRLFQGWHRPVPTLIESTPAEAVLHNDIFDLRPIPAWTKGRVTLLGDAAHAMTPNLGQGACQAIEDGLVLAAKLAGSNSVPAALQAYETARRGRTTQIVNRSRLIGRVAQWQNPLAWRFRNLVLQMLPSGLQLRQLDPVVGFELPV